MSELKNLTDLQSSIQKAVQLHLLPTALAHSILEKPPISISERIKIYQDAYLIRLMESLRDDFRRVEESIGNLEFENLANLYIKETPSRVRNLAEYSKGFPDFIKKNFPDSYIEAMKDWIEILSTQAAEPKDALGPEAIQNGSPFLLKISPSTQLVLLNDHCMVAYRKDDEIHFIQLDLILFELLVYLEPGRNFEDITVYTEQKNILSETLTQNVSEWIQKKIIYCKSI